jgi:hypothetical protein
MEYIGSFVTIILVGPGLIGDGGLILTVQS